MSDERPKMLKRVSFVWKTKGGANFDLPRGAQSRKTKIVCTLGPSSWDVPKIEELVGIWLFLSNP